MEGESKSCWFCRRPVLAGERANRVPHGRIAVHTECLRATMLSTKAPGLAWRIAFGKRTDADARSAAISRAQRSSSPSR